MIFPTFLRSLTSNSWKKEIILIKQPTKLIKSYLRQLSPKEKRKKKKKKQYWQKILWFKYDIKKRRTVIKEITGKAKHSKKLNIAWKLKIGNKIKTGEDEIANEFNKYYADIGPCLAKNIPNPSMPFESFLKRVNTTLSSQSLSINELKVPFFSENKQKCWCWWKKHYFGELCSPFKYLFDSSLQSEVFPGLMEIAIVSPVFKTGDTVHMSNCHPISVIPCFSKILEQVMCNHLYKYLTDQKILHPQHLALEKTTLQNLQLLRL